MNWCHGDVVTCIGSWLSIDTPLQRYLRKCRATSSGCSGWPTLTRRRRRSLPIRSHDVEQPWRYRCGDFCALGQCSGNLVEDEPPTWLCSLGIASGIQLDGVPLGPVIAVQRVAVAVDARKPNRTPPRGRITEDDVTPASRLTRTPDVRPWLPSLPGQRMLRTHKVRRGKAYMARPRRRAPLLSLWAN
ncbi:hypothetical protein DAEQUDRAFT_565242 [Daedalea quercina L-15889]|uniref:Uncharacterized protein n=1 Tax=Daedalea quercina L-15889 TaxID=1314783 RepID=A0A165LXF2_9APHY|nr:hypothetical protein DAEQUDRAFT_565242 [Daedalea quercina L-15889]